MRFTNVDLPAPGRAYDGYHRSSWNVNIDILHKHIGGGITKINMFKVDSACMRLDSGYWPL